MTVKRCESECLVIKSCGKWLCDNTLILILSQIFSSLSSDVKGLSLPGKKEGSIETFEFCRTAPVLYFNHNHNNSVSKKVSKQVH